MTPAEIYRGLQKVARERGRATDEIMTLYGLERFLARLSQTPYAQDFCLKGGVLLSAHALRRPTRDIDMQAMEFELDVNHLTEVVEAVISVAADDALIVDMSTMKIDHIRDEDEYAGLRVSLPAKIDIAKIIIKLDVSTGDPIWPEPQPITLPGLLGGTVVMKGHPLETVIAEKTVTMLQRGTTSTRWRDLLDVARLAGHSSFRASAIRTASQHVASYRGADLGPLRDLMSGYGDVGQRKWAAWRVKNKLEDMCLADLDEQVEQVLIFIEPIFDGSAEENATWNPDSYSWS